MTEWVESTESDGWLAHKETAMESLAGCYVITQSAHLNKDLGPAVLFLLPKGWDQNDERSLLPILARRERITFISIPHLILILSSCPAYWS